MTFEQDQRFGKVVLLNETKKISGKIYQKIKCDCGCERYIRNDRFPNVISCGCERRNKVGLSAKDYERLFNVWRNMIHRCYDPKNDRYYTYGAKGITVCEEWKNDFKCFAKWAVDNGWKVGLSIERKDIKQCYSPNNCTFITMKEQARNKSTNVLLTLNGKTKCVAEWSEIIGLDAKTIYARISRGHTDPSIILYAGDLKELRKRA